MSGIDYTFRSLFEGLVGRMMFYEIILACLNRQPLTSALPSQHGSIRQEVRHIGLYVTENWSTNPLTISPNLWTLPIKMP